MCVCVCENVCVLFVCVCVHGPARVGVAAGRVCLFVCVGSWHYGARRVPSSLLLALALDCNALTAVGEVVAPAITNRIEPATLFILRPNLEAQGTGLV